MPNAQLFFSCLLLIVTSLMDKFTFSLPQQASDNITWDGGANQCNELLRCENDMMAIHKRCTEQSRKATAKACQLTQQFLDLNRLMDIRIVQFQKCVLMENSTSSSDASQLTELPGECNTKLEHTQPLVKPEMGCWRAVGIIRSHCQRIRKCCPSADLCMERLRSSQATRSLRAKHIEINKKTLECRNQMRELLTGKKGRAYPEINIQAKYHSVLISQKDTQMGVAKQKYFFKLTPFGHKPDHRKAHRKPVYAAPRAKVYPHQKTAVTPPQKPPTYRPPLVELTKVRKLKIFESDVQPEQFSVTTQLAKFEGLLSELEKKGIDKKEATVNFKEKKQSSRVHSSKDSNLTKSNIDVAIQQGSLKCEHPEDMDSNNNQKAPKVGGNLRVSNLSNPLTSLFSKKSAIRRSKKHFSEQVFSANTLSSNLLSSDTNKPPTNSREVGGDQSEGKPLGLFQMEVDSGVVPKIFNQPQAQAFALPSNLDINRLKLPAARPNHSWRQSDQRRRVAMAGQLLAQGRLNVLGKRVPLVKAHGVGIIKQKLPVKMSQELAPFSQSEVTTAQPRTRPTGWAMNKSNLSRRMRTLAAAAASWHKKRGNDTTDAKKVWGESPKKIISGKNKTDKEMSPKKSTTTTATKDWSISVPFARLDEEGQELPDTSSHLQSFNIQMSSPTENLLGEKKTLLADQRETVASVLKEKNNPKSFMVTPSPYLERTVASIKEWSWHTTNPTTTLSAQQELSSTIHGLRDHDVTILPQQLIDFDSGVFDLEPFSISSKIRRKPTSTLPLPGWKSTVVQLSTLSNPAATVKDGVVDTAVAAKDKAMAAGEAVGDVAANSGETVVIDASAEGSQPASKTPGRQVHITLPVATSTPSGPSMTLDKKKSVIDKILARKQLQRILVPLASGMAGGRLLGYRNKVLNARRQLSSLVDSSTEKKGSHSHRSFVDFKKTRPALLTSFKIFKKHRSETEKHSPVRHQENWFQRTTLGISPTAEEQLSVTIFPRTEIRRAPTRLPPPPLVPVTDPISEKTDAEDELLLVKHNLILNLEKFLDERKDEVKQKLELRLEKDRLGVLRRPKSEFDLKHHLTGYCEIYSTCIDQMKYVQNKCQQLPDGSFSGRLLPGLPKRRFGNCNAKLLGLFQRIDILHLELEENVENCLVEKIATGTASTSESCPKEWPTLPAFQDDSNSCVQRVSLIQNHCKKLGHCCNSLDRCRQTADNSPLAKRLTLEEERLKRKSAECQIQSYDEYRRLRVLQQRTDEQLVDGLPALSKDSTQETHVQDQLNAEERSEAKRFLI